MFKLLNSKNTLGTDFSAECVHVLYGQ